MGNILIESLLRQNMDKEKKNKQQEGNLERQEKMSSTFKVAMITVISTLLIIAILLLLILFGMKRCQSNTTSGSSEQPIDTERNNKITDVFKDIVKKQMVTFGYDEDELKDVNVVSYEDNYPTSFDLNIAISSDTKVYYYYSSNVQYPDSKDGYDNFVSYLLLDSTSHNLSGDVTLTSLEKVNGSINTTETAYKAVVGKDTTDAFYLSGFKYKDNSFFVFQKEGLDCEEAFLGDGDQKISSGDQLFDYYRGLLAQ